MKKRLLLLLMILMLGGCNKAAQPRLLIFYSETCPNCQALKSTFIDKVADLNLEIVWYDIDQSESETLYQEIAASLDQSDSALGEEAIVPFMVLEGKLAVAGYSQGMDDFYLELFQKALDGQLNQYNLPSGSWLYKEE